MDHEHREAPLLPARGSKTRVRHLRIIQRRIHGQGDRDGSRRQPDEPDGHARLRRQGRADHGLPDYDTAATRRVDAYTSETTRKKNGKVVQTVRRELSPDGRTLILTTTRREAHESADVENIAEAVLTDGLASREEIDRIVADLYAFAADERTITGMPRVVQAWARRPPV